MKKKRNKYDEFKMELASDIFADIKNGYDGDLTGRQSGMEAAFAVREIIKEMDSESKKSQTQQKRQ